MHARALQHGKHTAQHSTAQHSTAQHTATTLAENNNNNNNNNNNKGRKKRRTSGVHVVGRWNVVPPTVTELQGR
eukprot:SAG31_NODE_38997_length_291_cov_1.552083_1_plen_73_part_01